MSRARHRLVATGWTLALLFAHLVPVTDGDSSIMWGFMPVELAYRLAWMGCAMALILYITVFVWPDEPADIPAAGGEG